MVILGDNPISCRKKLHCLHNCRYYVTLVSKCKKLQNNGKKGQNGAFVKQNTFDPFVGAIQESPVGVVRRAEMWVRGGVSIFGCSPNFFLTFVLGCAKFDGVTGCEEDTHPLGNAQRRAGWCKAPRGT